MNTENTPPNTKFLNKQINSWIEKDIDFYGIYHTHYPVGETLSQADMNYIKNIMISLPHIYSELYFPIVIPRKDIVIYKAKLTNSNLTIIKDKLVIID